MTEGTVYNAMGRINRLSVLCIDAYGVAVKNGFEGTVEEWLASLKGEKGDPGKDGTLKFEELSPEEKAMLKGDPFTYEDFTAEQLAALKGEPGYTPQKGVDYFDGNDGFSPIVSVTDIDGGHRVTITDVNGTESFDVMDGKDGLNGNGSSAGGAVLYTAQSLTESQKTQARANIGAAAEEIIENISGEVFLNYPNNCRLQLASCYRYGKICIFILQIFVDTIISDNYSFTLATLPVGPVNRVWINNGTQFFMDQQSAGNIRVNDEKLSAGGYTLSGFFLIDG